MNNVSEIQVQMTIEGFEKQKNFTFEDRSPIERAKIIAKLSAIHREKLYAAEALRRRAS